MRMKHPHKNIALSFLLIVFLLFNSKKMQAQGTVAEYQNNNRSLIDHIVKNRPELVKLLTAAGLIPTLSNSSEYTLLAPPEDALQEYKEESPERLRLLLAGHIIKGKYLEKDFKDGATVQTLAGTNVRVCKKKGNTLVNGVAININDLAFRNGIVHGMGSTLNP